MDYIRKNKVYILLVTVLSIIIAYLLIALYQVEDNTPIEPAKQEFSIVSFNGHFDETNKSVNLSWHIQDDWVKLKELHIYLGDKMLTEVNNKTYIKLKMSDYDINTGKNTFILKAKLKDGTEKSESVDVYIDEAFGFTMQEKIKKASIVYTIEYYYDTRRSVNVPTASVYASKPFGIHYLNSKTIDKLGNLIHKQASYELTFTGIESGTYDLSIEWNCVPYDVIYSQKRNIQVNGGKKDE